MAKLKPHLSLMNLNDRKVIINSKLKSILDYGLPLYLGESNATTSKMEATYMSINCIIHWNYTFRVNKVKICNDFKSDPPKQSMAKTAVTYLHKHMLHKNVIHL